MKAPRANRYRDSWAGELRADAVGDRKRVAGWVHRRRDHGGLIFIDLRDRTGLLQLVFRPDDAPEAHEQAHDLRAEDVISAAGAIAPREEGTVNPKLPTGEIELNVAEFELLSDAETPPFPIDEDSEVGDELRLRYRYLDLRRERMRRNIELRHDVVTSIREHLNARGVPRDRDADPHPLDARGRARLPGAQPAPARRLVRAATVAPALQAATDGRGLRALLPDPPLLP